MSPLFFFDSLQEAVWLQAAVWVQSPEVQRHEPSRQRPAALPAVTLTLCVLLTTSGSGWP